MLLDIYLTSVELQYELTYMQKHTGNFKDKYLKCSGAIVTGGNVKLFWHCIEYGIDFGTEIGIKWHSTQNMVEKYVANFLRQFSRKANFC
jgi:hypothetical protein